MNASLLLALTALALLGCGRSSVHQAAPAQTHDDLPDIVAFLRKPSDRFLVDIKEISRGHPFLGVNAPHPHAGAHVHFDNSKNRCPGARTSRPATRLSTPLTMALSAALTRILL
jgi:hypothetical protein